MNTVWNVEDYINKADIVVSLGRGIYEGMACGRACYIYDYNGSDGWIDTKNIKEARVCNCSGRRFKRDLKTNYLVEDLKKYRQEMGEVNRRIAEEEYNIKKVAKRLEEIYKNVIDGKAIKNN